MQRVREGSFLVNCRFAATENCIARPPRHRERQPDYHRGMVNQAPPLHARGRRHGMPPRRATPLGIALQVVAWLIAAVMIVLILALVVVPRVVGAQPYTVTTGSMRPTMPPGTVVVVRSTEFARIHVGDVITYQLKSGEPEVVTHRVVSVDVAADGTVGLKTRGDDNPSADILPVHEKQVRGVVWYWVPLVGYVGAFGGGDTRSIAAKVLGAALLGYAAFVLVSALAKRGRRRRPERVAPEDVQNFSDSH
jgi:signal peptidase